jgi:putative DNA primase/helicase
MTEEVKSSSTFKTILDVKEVSVSHSKPNYTLPELAEQLYRARNRDYHFKITNGDYEIYRYDKDTGLYVNDAENLIRQDVHNVLGKAYTEHSANEVISWFKTSTGEERPYWIKKEDWNKDINLIATKNRVINLINFKDYDLCFDYLMTISIPVKFNPDAKMPLIEKFLKEILHEDDIPIIQELTGYLLYRSYKFQKAFMFCGDGCNGKSTLINLFKKFLGDKNTSGVSLQDLTFQRFAREKLINKLANLYSDISSDAIQQTGIFKMLTGEDSIFADRKFREPIEFYNTAKLIFSCNKLPDAIDDSDAYFRRWVIIDFPNKFDGEKCDENLLDKLTTEDELSGLLNWALEGLKRLLNNHKFSNSKTTEEIKSDYIRRASPVRAFINDCLDIVIGERVNKTELYDSYRDYCNIKGYDVLANNVFPIRLKQFIPSLWEMVSNDNKRVWVNIKFKTPYKPDKRCIEITPDIFNQMMNTEVY